MADPLENDAARVESPPPPFSMPPSRHMNDAVGATNNIHNLNDNNNLNISFPANANINTNTNANQQMEQVTFHLHSRLCNFGLTHTSYRTRKIFEHLLLVIAICCACALLMLHRTFVVSATAAHSSSSPNTAVVSSSSAATSTTPSPSPLVSTCLDRLEGFDPASADITHLVILPNNLTIGSVAVIDGTGERSESKSKVLWNRGNRKKQAPTRTRTPSSVQTECAAHLDDSESSVSTNSIDATTTTNEKEEEDPEHREYREWLDQQLASDTLPIKYSYSTTKAYLMLPYDHSWLKHDLDVQYVLVAPTDPVCFGEPFVQFLLWNCFIGGNTVLLNWLLTFPAHEDIAASAANQPQHQPQHQHNRKQPSKGYIYDPRTQWLKEVGGDNQATRNAREGNDNANGNTGKDSDQLSSSTSLSLVSSKWNRFLAKVGVFLRTSFLFFFCTTLVSFTLRETQERMLDFTRELSRRVRQSISLSDLITTHLVQNLVFVPIMLGMMFFLIEFYHGDKFLAFSISSIVWSVEGFSLVCLRSSQGLQYFPYFFFLLFLLFHVYQTAFEDNGFVYMALTVVWCFMLHSMVFFWHRYELPALVLGVVSVHRPRMNSSVDEYTNVYNGDDPSGSGAAVHNTHNNDGRSGSFGASNGMTAPSRRRQQQQHDETPLLVTRGVTSIDGNHLTAPLLMTSTATSATATAVTTTRNSSSLLSGNGGGAGTGFLASRQSFQSSTSSRRTSELYQLNQEDDSSTGSHLYFMGGEVVVHQRRTPANHSNHNNNSHSNSELSPPTIRRGNSFGNASAVGAPSTTIGMAAEEESSTMAAPLSSFIRNESNFSLMSFSSDAYAYALANNDSNNTLAIGLDVTGRWSGDQEDDLVATNIHSSFCDALPNDTSMETVQASNVSTPPKKHQPTNHTLNDNDGGASAIANTATTMASDGCYAEESGGLQAILETKLTPRHRNTNQRPITEQDQTTLTMMAKQQQQQRSPDSSLSSPGIPYQRSPPKFPELTQPN
jgi:hypothetical protein